MTAPCESPILSDYGTVSEHVSQESVVVMNIGSYTFQEFKRLAENFHGYAAPGLIIGGYMVEMAKARIPEGTLFEAVVETRKCLPDAVQLLTLCSAGNNWMKVHNLGRYAVSLFDKHTGEGGPRQAGRFPGNPGLVPQGKAQKGSG